MNGTKTVEMEMKMVVYVLTSFDNDFQGFAAVAYQNKFCNGFQGFDVVFQSLYVRFQENNL